MADFIDDQAIEDESEEDIPKRAPRQRRAPKRHFL
jgi:hypothetical protein